MAFIEDTNNCEYAVFPDPLTVTLSSMTTIAASGTPATQDLSTMITRTSALYDNTACTFTLDISPASVTSFVSIDQATKVVTLQSMSYGDAGTYTVSI